MSKLWRSDDALLRPASLAGRLRVAGVEVDDSDGGEGGDDDNCEDVGGIIVLLDEEDVSGDGDGDWRTVAAGDEWGEESDVEGKGDKEEEGAGSGSCWRELDCPMSFARVRKKRGEGGLRDGGRERGRDEEDEVKRMGRTRQKEGRRRRQRID